ncbi:hypothetical protein [Cupriavidus sp. AcVe19-6a]|uniref:hypothetical protein n=1 Tax=Cupriavidus sp. AcVe19-6a TaxID=2821358 RepID=UPI001AEB5D43|nr:hypothetical protein [Cupriavidus sp. AcVe19-6a]MBP0639605.1 hypothetical protein [Cupriavidus sp. AcVe19-6a]
MSRARIRLQKRAVLLGTQLSASEADITEARRAALQLLRHSVKFGHRRLAVVRLLDAVKLNAVVDDELWDYCEGAEADFANLGQIRALRAMCRSGTARQLG